MKRILLTLESADGIIVASPVYFGSVTGQLKAVFDRTIPLRRQGFGLKNKVGCAISVWRIEKRRPGKNTGDHTGLDAHSRCMIIVGDDAHFGGIGVRPAAEDRIGRKTVVATANKLCDLLERTAEKKSCWGGD